MDVGMKICILFVTLMLVSSIAVFAQPVLSVKVGGNVSIAKFAYVKQNGLDLTVYLSCEDCNDVIGNQGYLIVYVIDEPGRIVYQDILPVRVQQNLTIPYNIPGWVFKSEGKYYIKFIYEVSTATNEYSAEDSFYVLVTSVEGSAIRILGIHPNIIENKTFEFNTGTQDFVIEIYNPLDYIQYVTAKVEIEDLQGNIILSRSELGRLWPNQISYVTVPVSFLAIPPGKYKLVFMLLRGPYMELKIVRNIVVWGDKYLPIKVYSITQYPFEAKPGEYVKFALLVKNQGEPLQLKLVAISPKLNLYKETGTIEIDSGEVKTINLVIKLPENITSGEYPITFEFLSGVAKKDYTYYLNVETPHKVKPIVITFEGPSNLIIGKTSEGKLVFVSNVENLFNYKILIFSRGATVKYNNTLTIGGRGEVEVLPVWITPTDKKFVLNIEVFDPEGNVVYNVTKEYFAYGEVNLRYYIAIALTIAVIILAICIILGYFLSQDKKRRKRRKIEEAE